MHTLQRACMQMCTLMSQHLSNVHTCTCMVLKTPVWMYAYSPQKIHMHSCMHAYATVQKLLCCGNYCELILSLVRASCRLSFAARPAAVSTKSVGRCSLKKSVQIHASSWRGRRCGVAQASFHHSRCCRLLELFGASFCVFFKLTLSVYLCGAQICLIRMNLSASSAVQRHRVRNVIFAPTAPARSDARSSLRVAWQMAGFGGFTCNECI